MSRLSTRSLLVAAASAAVLTSLPASAATTAFAYDWDNAPVFLPGVNFVLGPFFTEAAAGGPYNGSNGKSWAGNHGTRPDTNAMSLSMTDLPAHTSLSIDFLLGFLNSWDSIDGSPAPDILTITIDGVPVAQLTTVIAGGTVNNHGGGTLLVDNGQIDGNVFFADDLVDMGTAAFLTFPHNAPTLTISWQAGGNGYQSFPDEYWGIDSLSVTLLGENGIPEPGTLALLGAIGLGALARRRAR